MTSAPLYSDLIVYEQNAQDPLEDYEVKPMQETQQKKRKLPKNDKRNLAEKKGTSASYVRIKGEKDGHRLIKIKVYDLAKHYSALETVENDEEALLSAQYIVTYPVDEILDQTEELVNKISKSLCNNF